MDLNSFIFGSGGGVWGDSNNFGVQSWANKRGTPAGVTTNPGVAANSATSFNTNDVGDIGKLTASLNSINQAAQKAAQAGRIPNNPALEAQSSKNIGAELGGQVPGDVISLLGQQGAERGVAGGFDTSSPNANAAYLRALGLTSIGQMDKGQTHLTEADARNPIAPIVDASKYTLTPAESAQINLGYLSEADRTQLERERLAVEAARGYGYHGGGGGYGGGGYDYGGGISMNDIGYFGPTQSYGAIIPPLTGSNTLGSPTANAGDLQARWLASITPSLNYGGGGGVGYGEGGIMGSQNFAPSYGPDLEGYGYG